MCPATATAAPRRALGALRGGDRTVQLHGQILAPRGRGRGFGTHYQKATVWQITEPRPHEVAQSALDPLADDRSTDRFTHDEADAGRIEAVSGVEGGGRG